MNINADKLNESNLEEIRSSIQSIQRQTPQNQEDSMLEYLNELSIKV